MTILRDDKENDSLPQYVGTCQVVVGKEMRHLFECVAREVYEELSIHCRSDVIWSRSTQYARWNKNPSFSWEVDTGTVRSIIFGDEGQGYKLVSFEEFLTSDRVVPQLQERVRDYVEESL